MNKCREAFLKDVANHEMVIVRDDQAYRHIILKAPSSGHYRFELITWPGYLCVCGDMGTYVFARLHDMFEFFRTDHSQNKAQGELAINLGYWSEKLQSVAHPEGYKEYCPFKFEKIVNELADDYISCMKLSVLEAEDFLNAIAEDVLNYSDTEESAHRAAANFKYKEFEFSDFWEHDLKEYTDHFVWCCYAIAWGVQQYDELA